MIRVKSRKRLFFIRRLSLGLIILGIGCFSWAMTGILSQPDFSAEAYDGRDLLGEGLNSSTPKEAAEVIYPNDPKKGEKLGSLSIPALKMKLPIYEGTSDKELNKGVGHYIQSVLPGEVDNCVLSGHRTSVFSKIGKLKKGDQLIVQTTAGIFTYEIKRIRIVDKNDRSVIVPTDSAVLTLSTCYPFRYVGDAPKRYILSADLVTMKTPSILVGKIGIE